VPKDKDMKGISFYGNSFFIIKNDVELVAESITRIIMTNQGERVDQPFFGCNLKAALFEMADTSTENGIVSTITEQLNTYEERADILSVSVAPDPTIPEFIIIEIIFKMTYQTEQQATALTLTVNQGTLR